MGLGIRDGRRVDCDCEDDGTDSGGELHVEGVEKVCGMVRGESVECRVCVSVEEN